MSVELDVENPQCRPSELLPAVKFHFPGRCLVRIILMLGVMSEMPDAAAARGDGWFIFANARFLREQRGIRQSVVVELGRLLANASPRVSRKSQQVDPAP